MVDSRRNRSSCFLFSDPGRNIAEEERMKPVILVTRKLPDAVEERLRRDYDARLNPEDVLYSRDELIERTKDVDAILPCHTEKFTAEVIARLPERVRAIANFSVGYDHVDIKAAKARGIIVTNTPEGLSDATAALTTMLLLGGEAGQRRRTAGPQPCVEGLEPPFHGGHPGDGQAARDSRIRADRTGRRQASPWIRHEDPLPPFAENAACGRGGG